MRQLSNVRALVRVACTALTSCLSCLSALAAATRTPGELIRRSIPGSEPFGTIAIGNRADLVLSAADPLEDLAALREPLGVMAKGKWYSQSDLQALCLSDDRHQTTRGARCKVYLPAVSYPSSPA